MKNLLQYLLIIFALALCALVAIQWQREARLQRQLQPLTEELQKQRNTATALSNSVTRANAEILRLNTLTNQLAESLKSSQAEIDQLKSEPRTATNPEEVEAYKKALETANARIAKQNEEMQKLASDHNTAALQFNKLTEDYNELVKKWNAQQELLSKGFASPDNPTK